MKKIIVVLIAAALAFTILWRAKPQAPSVGPVAAPSHVPPTDADRAVRVRPPIPRLRPLPAPIPTDRVRPADAPSSKDELPLWSGIKPASVKELPPEAVARMQALFPDEQMRALVDYQLSTLHEIEKCVGDRVKAQGDVSMLFKFDVKDGTGLGSSLEVRNSSLSEEDDEVVLDCARKAHDGKSLRVYDNLDPNEPVFAWATTLRLPIARSPIYATLLKGE